MWLKLYGMVLLAAAGLLGLLVVLSFTGEFTGGEVFWTGVVLFSGLGVICAYTGLLLAAPTKRQQAWQERRRERNIQKVVETQLLDSTTKALGVVSFVTGVLTWIVPIWPFFLSALITGIIAGVKGYSLGWWGLVIGAAGIVFWAVRIMRILGSG